MTIDPIGSQLAYLKVGIVITVINDITTYPTGNTATSFQYAGVYMNYTLFNTAQPIIQAAGAGTFPRVATVGEQNFNYFTLLSARYQIYGLSSFYIANLPSNITVVNYELTVGPSSTVLFQTDDVNYMTSVKISADQWSNIGTGTCNPSTTVMRMIVQKYLSTVPTMQNDQQTIYETSADLNFNYFAEGSYADLAATPLSAVVVYNNIMYFEQITVGAPYRLDFSIIFDNSVGATGIPFPLSATTSENQVVFTIKIEGNVIYSQLFEVTAAGVVTTETHQFGMTFTTATPTV